MPIRTDGLHHVTAISGALSALDLPDENNPRVADVWHGRRPAGA